MNIKDLNRLRRTAGLPDLTKEERIRIEEKSKKAEKKAEKLEMLEEAANNRAGDKLLSSIAKQHCHVRSLKKTGDDGKDYHDIPCWALENALKAAFKAGFDNGKAKAPVKEGAEKLYSAKSDDKESPAENKKAGFDPEYDPKGGEPKYKDGKDEVEKETGKKGKDKEAIKEGEYEEEFQSNFKKDDIVNCKGTIMIVQTPDGEGTMVKLIPADMADSNENDRNRAAKDFDHKDIVPASEEECEQAESMRLGGIGPDMEDEMMGDEMGMEDEMPMDRLPMEGKEDKAPKARNFVSKHSHNKSGAGVHKAKKGKGSYNRKDKKNMMEDKADDAVVFGKDYDGDGRTDKDETVDQFKNRNPNDLDKITVPNKYKKSLKEAINKLREESDLVRVRDPYGSEHYENTANAFEMLLGHLEEGTRRALMLAQVDMNRLMSPMITRLPNEVYMYIVRGGKPSSLNELFHEVKVKDKTGADLSKEKYTK